MVDRAYKLCVMEIKERAMGYWKRRFIIALALLFVLIMASISQAVEPVLRYVKYDNGAIQCGLKLADSLPTELVGYINKGVPILFVYRLELWRQRSGWFDKLLDASETNFRVRFDSWEKRYSVVQSTENLIVENILGSERETIDLLSSTGPDTFAVDDTSGVFYLVGRLTIKTMSFSNYKEVESWLKGGISSAKKPELENASNKLGEFVFNMALRVTGLKDISREVRSESFTIDHLPQLDER